MARTGRPPKQINREEFEELCKLQCTEEEICAVFDCSHPTLNSWCKENYLDEDGNPMTFLQVFKQKRLGGKASLRRSQWKLAEKNPTMAIFLGKQYLGQTDSGESVDKSNLSRAIEILGQSDTAIDRKGRG